MNLDFSNNNNNNNHHQNSNKQNNNQNQNEQNYIIETNEFNFKSHFLQSLLSKNSDSLAKSSSSKHNNNIINDELKKTTANNNKKISNHIDKLEESRFLNNYNYRYQILHPNRESDYKNRLANCNNNINKNRNFLQLKLKDLIDVNREKIFIDNLYAQFYSDSNIINLVYVSPMDKIPENSILLDNGLFSAAKNSASGAQSGFFSGSLSDANISTNKLLNDFYLNAALRRNNSSNSFEN
jgi:hypothetical protein